MATALTSAATNRQVRRDVAMTGEVTLRGRVLPVGGLKEKILAAKRAGIKIVILPKRNLKDLDEVPKQVRKDLQFVFVDTMDQVLPVALKSPGRSEKHHNGVRAPVKAKPRRPSHVAPSLSSSPRRK